MTSSESPTRPKRLWPWLLAAATVIAVVAGGVWFALDHHHQTVDTSMAARAQQVMPFNLNRTTHTFTKTLDGGVQTVVVKDQSDTRDRSLIRSHLTSEAESFRHGNFSDPARIHGMDMPGVNELEQGASRVTVVYAELPGGARITYTSPDPTLVAALHDWFDRQASDHSMAGMGG